MKLLLVCLIGVVTGFAFGLWGDIGEPPRWAAWSVAALSLVWIFAVAVMLRRAGRSVLWAGAALPSAGCAAVLGDFAPYAIGLGERSLNDYSYDTPWEFILVASLVYVATAGVFVGLAAALGAAMIPERLLRHQG